MLRRLMLALLFASAFWQALAIAGRATAFGKAEEAAHAMLHWQEQAHHHHDDGSVALDESEESTQHVLVDGCLGATAVWFAASIGVVFSGADRPAAVAAAPPPWPHIDGPRRPPRLTS